MNVVLYARVSSEQQAERDLSIPAQISSLEDYAKTHHHTVVGVFKDEAKSGRTMNRPGFKKMLSLVEQKDKTFEAILVWKFSRFSRSRYDSIVVKTILEKNGVQLISINEQVDDTASGKMIEGMLEVLDEFYSNNLACDTMRGMKENAGRGFYCGGSVPFGYRLKTVNINGSNKKIFETDPEKAPLVKKIFDMSLSGEGAKDIAKYMNEFYPKATLWTSTCILGILHNEVYTGTFLWNKKNKESIIKVPETHEPIIDCKDFLKVQLLIKQRSPNIIHPRTISCKNLLNGLLYCSDCGKQFTSYSAKSGKFHYYSCTTKLKTGLCKQKAQNINKFDSFILSVLKERVLTRENIAELLKLVNEEMGLVKNEYQSRLANIGNLIKDRERRLEKLFNLVETTDIDMKRVSPRIKQLGDEKDELIKEKKSLEYELSIGEYPKLTEKELEPYIEDLQKTLLEGTVAERKAFIRSFVKKITVDYPAVEIEYAIPLDREKKLDKEVLTINKTGWGE
jgi:site-specific DNA recombinase